MLSGSQLLLTSLTPLCGSHRHLCSHTQTCVQIHATYRSGMAMHTFNPSTQVVKKLISATSQSGLHSEFTGQPGLHSKILSHSKLGKDYFKLLLYPFWNVTNLLSFNHNFYNEISPSLVTRKVIPSCSAILWSVFAMIC